MFVPTRWRILLGINSKRLFLLREQQPLFIRLRPVAHFTQVLEVANQELTRRYTHDVLCTRIEVGRTTTAPPALAPDR